MTGHVWTFTNAPSSKTGPICPECQTIHSGSDVVAVDRFNPDGPAGFRAHFGGEVRATRAAAMSDVCAMKQRGN